jgi:hypothetical protein
MASEFWVRSGGRESGPHSSNDLREMARSGALRRFDTVSSNRERWHRADSVKGLDWPPIEAQAVVRKELDPAAAILKRFASDDQDPGIVLQMLERVRELCTANEEIRYIAVQRKPVVTLSPDAAVATTRRLIFLKTSLLGKAELIDFVWRDIQNAHIKESVLSSIFLVTTITGSLYSMDYLPKKQARALYRIAQEIEERTREERRVRKMEEDRARSGTVQIPVISGGGSAESSSAVDALRTLKQLHAEGLITDSEFESKRQQIISRM